VKQLVKKEGFPSKESEGWEKPSQQAEGNGGGGEHRIRSSQSRIDFWRFSTDSGTSSFKSFSLGREGDATFRCASDQQKKRRRKEA